MDFEKFYLIMLKDGPADEPDSEEEMAVVRSAHLDYQSGLYHEHGAVAGPLRGDRGVIQGITLVPEGDLSMAQVQALAEGDPAVKAGYLSVQVVEWHVGKGKVALHQKS